jgi:hypothetical protein
MVGFGKIFTRMGDWMDFSRALDAAKAGQKITRNGWNGKGLWVEIQIPDLHSNMTRPYLYLASPKGSTNQFGPNVKDVERVPWLASQTDLLAEDWSVIQEQKSSITNTKLYAYKNSRGNISYLESEFGGNQYVKRCPEKDKTIQ